jgi:hypothetical protein
VGRQSLIYRGVGTTCETPPGTSRVLVPFPLFISVPGTTDPGIMIVCADPLFPVTSPGPREVGALDPEERGADPEESGAMRGGGGGELCAIALVIVAARTVIARNQASAIEIFL